MNSFIVTLALVASALIPAAAITITTEDPTTMDSTTNDPDDSSYTVIDSMGNQTRVLICLTAPSDREGWQIRVTIKDPVEDVWAFPSQGLATKEGASGRQWLVTDAGDNGVWCEGVQQCYTIIVSHVGFPEDDFEILDLEFVTPEDCSVGASPSSQQFTMEGYELARSGLNGKFCLDAPQAYDGDWSISVDAADSLNVADMELGCTGVASSSPWTFTPNPYNGELDAGQTLCLKFEITSTDPVTTRSLRKHAGRKTRKLRKGKGRKGKGKGPGGVHPCDPTFVKVHPNKAPKDDDADSDLDLTTQCDIITGRAGFLTLLNVLHPGKGHRRPKRHSPNNKLKNMARDDEVDSASDSADSDSADSVSADSDSADSDSVDGDAGSTRVATARDGSSSSSSADDFELGLGSWEIYYDLADDDIDVEPKFPLCMQASFV